MKRMLVGAAIVSLAGATACTRLPGGVAPSNIPIAQGQYTELGPVEAQDCKVNILMFIPVSGANHVKDAVSKALGRRPGTDALVNITVDRVFKFFLLWSQTCTQVFATAVSLK
jgi:hypothetical protein